VTVDCATAMCNRRYDAIIDLTRRLNNKYQQAGQVQEATRGILNSLFPSWLPGAFKVRGLELVGLSRWLVCCAQLALCRIREQQAQQLPARPQPSDILSLT
jgi:hypothetical protein